MSKWLSKILIMPNGCVIWTGTGRQYGHVKWKGKLTTAHRGFYEIFKQEIPYGMELHHLCSNTRCVNPNHLEVVTNSENLKRKALNNTQIVNFAVVHDRKTGPGVRLFECEKDAHAGLVSMRQWANAQMYSLCRIDK